MSDQSLTSGCPTWCVQTTPHGIHQSPLVIHQRGPSRWCISAGQVDGGKPHVTICYLGEQASADATWQLAPEEAHSLARFAARLGEAQVAVTITQMADRARADLVLAGELLAEARNA